MTLLSVVGQSVVIYLFLVLALSRLGRIFMAGLTPVSYLVVALLGSAVETGLYKGSGSLAAGIVSASTILLLDHLLTRLASRWPRVRRLLAGGSIVLIHDGQLVSVHLRQVRMTEEDMKAAVRNAGYAGIPDVRLAVLESNGKVTIVPRVSDARGPSA